MTKKNLRNERLKKVYREYTRIKFKKYSLQFPRLRAEELFNKILREWQDLDEEAKDDLEKEYLERSGTAFLLISSSSSDEKKKKKASGQALTVPTPKPLKQSKKVKKLSPKVRVFDFSKSGQAKFKILKDTTSDYARSDEQRSGKKSTPDKNESSSDLKDKKKTKKIQKRILKEKKRTEELNFRKYYFEKLSAEHPRWDKNQVFSIVKLLWQRKQRAKGKIQRTSKGLSGRQLYRRQKEAQGFQRQQIKYLWRALPHESKRYWQFKGNGFKRRNVGKNIKKILGSGITQDNNNKTAFNWMEKSIK